MWMNRVELKQNKELVYIGRVILDTTVISAVQQRKKTREES